MTERDRRVPTLKNTIFTRMLVDTADQNYITARWAFHQGMMADFLWNSVHCLEKYLKASLLLNGHSLVKKNGGKPKFGHNPCDLFDVVKSYCGDLLPSQLLPPPSVKLSLWSTQTMREYMHDIYRYGNAHGRYNLYGHIVEFQHLVKLDQCVFWFRRSAFGVWRLT